MHDLPSREKHSGSSHPIPPNITVHSEVKVSPVPVEVAWRPG